MQYEIWCPGCLEPLPPTLQCAEDAKWVSKGVPCHNEACYERAENPDMRKHVQDVREFVRRKEVVGISAVA